MEIDYDTLFYHVDNFCMGFEPWYQRQLLTSGKAKRKRQTRLSLSEVMTILIAYHQSGFTCFKYFYLYLLRSHASLFRELVHYDRFITLIKRAFPALVCFMKSLEGKPTHYQFIDSTSITVCHIRREKSHKVFEGLAEKGRTSTGWFFGFKLHLILNTQGDIVRLLITPGNTSDLEPVPNLTEGLLGKLIGDKGYLSQAVFDQLFARGLTMVTKIRKNMKNRLMEIQDKIMLYKRGFIETVIGAIKALNTFVHHRHRSPINAFCHLFAGLINYQIRDDKPNLAMKESIIP